MGTFTVDITKFSNKVKKDINTSVKAIKLSLFRGVIKDTRVRTGRLRGNWQISVGTPILGEIDRLDKTGNKVISDVVQKITHDDIDFLTNNLPYAQIWEGRDGMIARNVLRIVNNINNV